MTGFWRGTWWRIAAIGVVACASGVNGQTDDASMRDAALEGFLERLGLSGLLVQQLEARMAGAPVSERTAIAEKLAKAYAGMLSSSTSASEAEEWEKRSRELLSRVPEADSFELRVNLNRAIYLRSEEVAERQRLRLVSAEDVAQAQQSLRTVAQQSRELGAKLNGRVLQLEKLESTLEGTDALDQELQDARRLRSLAFYYAGWASVYLSQLSESEGPAVEAMKDFGWLLNSSGGRLASVDRVVPEMTRFEHIARSVLGCAMAASQRGNDVEALRWLDLVELSEEAAPAVREQSLARRISIYGAAKRWADLERTVRNARRVRQEARATEIVPLSPALARLVGVIALEADRRIAGAQIESLAKIAMGDLVARKEVGQVLDLVRKYGTAPLGESGFIVHYVRGLQQYEQARAQHPGADSDPPEAPSAEVANMYRAASGLLSAALKSDDADEFGLERSRALVTLGRSLMYAGELREAASRFSEAWSASGKGAEGEEALWLAIYATDRSVREQGKLEGDIARRSELVTMFLQAYPDSARSPRLVLLQASEGEMTDEQALKVLAGVAKDAPMYEASRRQMARILYSRLRGASPGARDFAAAQFVSVAEELLTLDVRAATSASGTTEDAKAAGQRAVGRVRQMLDAIFLAGKADAARAEALMQTLESVARQAGVDVTEYQAELQYRRVQIAIERGDEAEAAAIADRLASRQGRGGQFGSAADYAVFRSIAAAWASKEGAARTSEAASRIVKVGVRILDGAGGMLADQRAMYVASATADAALGAFELSGDTAMRDLALRLDGMLLSVQANLGPALRRVARASESAGDIDRARAARTTLAEGAKPGSVEWFEARYDLALLLSKHDARSARKLLDQHKALYPEFGPPPWGERLRDLDASVPSAAFIAPDSTNRPNGDEGGSTTP